MNHHCHMMCSVKLRHFSKFVDMTEALSAATAAVEGKMNKGLKKILKKVFSSDVQEQLAVADAKLGSVIKVSLGGGVSEWWSFLHMLTLAHCNL